MGFVKDLVTLDVVTVTGKMEVKVTDVERRSTEDEKPKSVIDFDELFTRISGEVSGKAKLKIVAATRINIDKDTYNFVSEDLGEVGKELVELHFKSVDMAAKSRAEIIGRLLPNFGRKEAES